MVRTGREVAETMVEIFADLPPGHEFFEQYSFISSDDLPEFKTLLSRTEHQDVGAMRPADRTALLSLPFKVVVAQHRLGVISEALQAKILKAREIFADGLRSEEHTSELQSRMRISYAVFCLTKKTLIPYINKIKT